MAYRSLSFTEAFNLLRFCLIFGTKASSTQPTVHGHSKVAKGLASGKSEITVYSLFWSQPSVMCVVSSQKHGLVIIPDGTPNGDVNHESQSSGITVVSQEAAQVLESAGEGPLGESGTLPLCHRTELIYSLKIN